MGRPIRLSAPNTLFHVHIRCNNSEHLFSSDSDFLLLLNVLSFYKNKFHFKLYGYCIMNSHFHLIIGTPNNERFSISKIMHAILWRFAYTYNRIHKRKGHFFNGRFKSPIVQSDRYGLMLLKYIVQNPVRAGIVKRARDWRWSSYKVYAEGEYNPLIDLLPTYEGLSAKKKIASRMFREMVERQLMARDEVWVKGYVIGDKEFSIGVLRRFGVIRSDPSG